MSDEIIQLMNKLEIKQFCITTEFGEVDGKPELYHELMIMVENLDKDGEAFTNGATCFLSEREFTWGELRPDLDRLKELIGFTSDETVS